MRAIIIKEFGGVDSLYKAKPARVFQFDDIRDAHKAMDSNQANGKMVVRI